MLITRSFPPACSNSLAEEKRRLENKLGTIEEDLEEEQMNSETALEKARKAEQQADALTTENSQLQTNLHKAEAAKSQFEKQVSVDVGHLCDQDSPKCIIDKKTHLAFQNHSFL